MQWRGVSNGTAGVKDKEGGQKRAREMLSAKRGVHLRGGHEEGSREGDRGLHREVRVSWHRKPVDSRAAFPN